MSQPGQDAWNAIREPAPPPAAAPPPRQPVTTPTPVTYVLIAANVVAFGLQVLAGGIPAFGGAMSGRLLLSLGANSAFATFHEMRLETLVTSCFLHGSLIHIGFNMLALRQIGPFVERSAGRARMAGVYIASGIFASVASSATGVISGSERLSVGASGAICGLIGAALVVGWRVEGPRSAIVRAMANWLFTLLAFGLVVGYFARLKGIGGGFDNAAHAGGAASGAAIAVLWRRGSASSAASRGITYVTCIAIVAGSVLRLVQVNRTDPYAALPPEERALVVMNALKKNDCPTAQEALVRLTNVVPSVGADSRAIVYSQCGAPRGGGGEGDSMSPHN